MSHLSLIISPAACLAVVSERETEGLMERAPFPPLSLHWALLGGAQLRLHGWRSTSLTGQKTTGPASRSGTDAPPASSVRARGLPSVRPAPQGFWGGRLSRSPALTSTCPGPAQSPVQRTQ